MCTGRWCFHLSLVVCVFVFEPEAMCFYYQSWVTYNINIEGYGLHVIRPSLSALLIVNFMMPLHVDRGGV